MLNKHFRAWDVKNKRMLYIGSLSGVGDFYKTKEEEFAKLNETDSSFYELFHVWYKWMQYSGVEVNNNQTRYKKTICEDDIVQYTYDGKSCIGRVGFGEYEVHSKDYIYPPKAHVGFYIRRIDSEELGYRRTISLMDAKDLFLIGNAYENPELMEGNN